MAIGYLILATTSTVAARYGAVFLTTAVNIAIIPFFAWRLDTAKGTTASGVAIAGVVGIGNLGGITSPYLFPVGICVAKPCACDLELFLMYKIRRILLLPTTFLDVGYCKIPFSF